MTDDGVILIADNVRRALELRHNGRLARDLLYDAVKILFCLLQRHAFRQHALELRFALRHGDDLQCGLVDISKVHFLNLIDRAIAALPKLALDSPPSKYSGSDAICSHILFSVSLS